MIRAHLNGRLQTFELLDEFVEYGIVYQNEHTQTFPDWYCLAVDEMGNIWIVCSYHSLANMKNGTTHFISTLHKSYIK